MQLLLKNIKSLSPLNILFFIPLIPHFNIIEDVLHTDDIPVLLFLILFLTRIMSLFDNFKPIKGYLLIDFFILYLLIQNIYLGNSFFNTEILRFTFYAIIFFFILFLALLVKFFTLSLKFSVFLLYLVLFSLLFTNLFRNIEITYNLLPKQIAHAFVSEDYFFKNKLFKNSSKSEY